MSVRRRGGSVLRSPPRSVSAPRWPLLSSYAVLLRDDDRLQDLVREGLALLVPQRPQEADVAADCVDDVQEVAADRQAWADDLTILLAQQPSAHRALADRLPGPALADEVPDREA